MIFFLNEFYSLFLPCWRKSFWIHSVFPTTNFIWWFLHCHELEGTEISSLISSWGSFSGTLLLYPFWFAFCGKTSPFFNFFSKTFWLSLSTSPPFYKDLQSLQCALWMIDWLALPTWWDNTIDLFHDNVFLYNSLICPFSLHIHIN